MCVVNVLRHYDLVEVNDRQKERGQGRRKNSDAMRKTVRGVKQSRGFLNKTSRVSAITMERRVVKLKYVETDVPKEWKGKSL